MIQNIGGKLSALGLDRLQPDFSPAQPDLGTGLSFAQVMAAAQTGAQTDDLAEGTAAQEEGAGASEGSVTKNSFTGFFKELQEERMEELRKEILEEMGLTEEMLQEMDLEARGRIEGMIAKEIQKRMTAQSALDGEGEISLLAL